MPVYSYTVTFRFVRTSMTGTVSSIRTIPASQQLASILDADFNALGISPKQTAEVLINDPETGQLHDHFEMVNVRGSWQILEPNT
jgi:hypothetical protein